MRQNKIQFTPVLFFIIFAGLSTGCVKDNSQYDLHTLNQIQIEGDEAEITILQFDTLRIDPDIKQTLPVSDADLSFLWYVRNAERGGVEDIIVLDSTRNLKKSIGIKEGRYTLVLKVTEKKTGVMVMKHYPLVVNNQLSSGWLLLQEVGPVGDVSMILPSGQIFHHVYSDLNRNYPLLPPVLQISTAETYLEHRPKSIEILTENDAIQLDYSEMLKVSSFDDYFWEVPSVKKPQYFANLDMANNILINDGLLHIFNVGGFPGDIKYLSATPFDGTKGLDYYLEPFSAVGAPAYVGNTPYSYMYFDNKAKGFAYVSGASILPGLYSFPTPTETAAFNMNHIGLDLISLDRGYKAMFHNAIFRDNSNNLHLYQIDLNLTQPAVLKQALGTTLNGSTFFASSKLLQHIYFFKADKIYLYDIPLESASEVSSIPTAETITKVKITADELQFSTWDGTEGYFYIYTIGSRGELVLKQKFSSFGRIVDFAYKN